MSSPPLSTAQNASQPPAGRPSSSGTASAQGSGSQADPAAQRRNVNPGVPSQAEGSQYWTTMRTRTSGGGVHGSRWDFRWSWSRRGENGDVDQEISCGTPLTLLMGLVIVILVCCPVALTVLVARRIEMMTKIARQNATFMFASRKAQLLNLRARLRLKLPAVALFGQIQLTSTDKSFLSMQLIFEPGFKAS
ncbi:hypothetical protein QBC40DRAFT_349029 [Triangularia verruculosa]|uniref:Uncharacterized protein n=1 Tax=Triangularia verruculosa TaxID=2587418 RepID=A0AAN7AWI5_9PEZI|nr:hypothetical protein QBC40DRAFT_349029 [Triangularia verruculosa]